MASLEAFVLYFCALEHVGYARWFSIHLDMKTLLLEFRKQLQHCWALPESHNNF